MELSTNLRENANAGAVMVLRHPVTGEEMTDGEGRRASLTVLGNDADAVKQFDRAWQRKLQAEAARNAKAKITPEMWEQHAIDRAAASVSGWAHCSYKGTAEFSPELVREFLRNEPWAFEQLQEFQADRANFSAGSKTT